MKDIIELEIVNLITYFGTSSQITSAGTDNANTICRIISNSIYNLQEQLAIKFMNMYLLVESVPLIVYLFIKYSTSKLTVILMLSSTEEAFPEGTIEVKLAENRMKMEKEFGNGGTR